MKLLAVTWPISNALKTVSPILRDSAQRRAALMVNLRDRHVESWVREADAKVRGNVKLPEGYTLEFGGQFESLREARTRLAIVVPAARGRRSVRFYSDGTLDKRRRGGPTATGDSRYRRHYQLDISDARSPPVLYEWAERKTKCSYADPGTS